jgi:selenocysteine lyase/cysteine desulfurase
MTVEASTRAQRSGAVGGADSSEAFFDALRAREFGRLDRAGLAYLDYTGAGLAAESQLAAHDTLLRGAVLGNPHSEHAPSRAATVAVTEARAATLRLLDADPAEYAVCFAPNASGAAKIVSEAFPFAPDGVLALSGDNHN